MIAADQDFLGSALLLKVKRPPGFRQTENVMTKRGEKSEKKTTGKTPEVCFNTRKPREEREERKYEEDDEEEDEEEKVNEEEDEEEDEEAWTVGPIFFMVFFIY